MEKELEGRRARLSVASRVPVASGGVPAWLAGGDAPSVAAEALGPRHLISLALRGKAARIRHAQPGGAAAGLEELARVVTELGETVGAEHYLTRKHADALAAMRE